MDKSFIYIVSENEYIWINNCLSSDRINKRRTYKNWKIPSKFEHLYEDKTSRAFKISFPESACVEPIIGTFIVNSGKEIQFPQAMQNLCEIVANETGETFEIIFQALDIQKTVNEQKSTDSNIVTERVIKQRTQQQTFRKNVINLWGGKCALTNISFIKILTASHIKSFAICEHTQAYDPANGLLLCSHVDKLFDQGLITFDDKGQIMRSKHLPISLLQKIGIPDNSKLLFRNLTDKNKKTEILEYMKYHREKIFKK